MRRVPFPLLALVSFLASPVTLPAGEGPTPRERILPAESLLVLEVSDPAPILDAALSQGVESALRDAGFLAKLQANPGYLQFQGIVSLFESRMGCDWRAGLRRLLGGGFAWSVKADGSSVLIVDALDPEILARLHDTVLGFAGGSGAGTAVSRQYGGATLWTVGPEECHVVLGKRLILSNRVSPVEAAIDAAKAAGNSGIAGLAGFQAARRAMAGEPALLFINWVFIKEHPPVRRALEEAKNPLGSLLFAGVIASLQSSNWIAASLRAEDQGLRLSVTSDGSAKDGLAAFAAPSGDDGPPPNPSIPRRIASITLWRDLHGFYAAKDALFPERTSGLIFFENMMGIFFSGMDLTEEVLAETFPEIRLVVAEQSYGALQGRPQVELPAFALILRVRDPQDFGEILEEAWQKALGLINFTSGQKAQPGFIIDRSSDPQTKLTVAYYRQTKKEKEGNKGSILDMRHNFRPTLARTGEFAVFSSTEELARDVAAALAKDGGKSERVKGANGLLELDGPQLRSILSANRENLILQDMTEKGHSRREAEDAIGVLLDAVGFLDRARVRLGTKDERPILDLELKFRSAKASATTVRAAAAGASGPGAATAKGEDHVR